MSLPDLPLIGEVIPKIEGDQLPSKCEALRRLFYLTRVDRKPLDTSIQLVIEEVSTFWTKAGIPTKNVYRCKEILNGIYVTWRHFTKHEPRSENEVKKRDEWVTTLPKLLDLSPANVLDIINDRRKEFLENQRKEVRVGFISDNRLSDSEEDSQPSSTQTVSSVRERQSK